MNKLRKALINPKLKSVRVLSVLGGYAEGDDGVD
jgi:hypothetical protein